MGLTTGHRRVAGRYALAALALALIAGLGVWRWHAHVSTVAAARLVAEGRYTAAIRVLQERLATAPGDARLHYYLGLAYSGAGLGDGALNQLDEAVRLAPDRAAYHEALGQAYRDAGDLARARGELEESVRLDPTDVRYQASLGGLMLEQGQTDAALLHLRHTVERAPREPELRLLLAEALRRAGDREGMTREYREVIRLAAGRTLAEAARQELLSALAAAPSTRGVSGAASDPERIEVVRQPLPDQAAGSPRPAEGGSRTGCRGPAGCPR
jgi:tetratricopeptide (TPR) repeat protein